MLDTLLVFLLLLVISLIFIFTYSSAYFVDKLFIAWKPLFLYNLFPLYNILQHRLIRYLINDILLLLLFLTYTFLLSLTFLLLLMSLPSYSPPFSYEPLKTPTLPPLFSILWKYYIQLTTCTRGFIGGFFGLGILYNCDILSYL